MITQSFIALYVGSRYETSGGLILVILMLLGYGFRELVIHCYGPRYTKRQFKELGLGICFLGGTIYAIVAVVLAILK